MNALDAPTNIMFAGDWHGDAMWAARAVRQAADEGCTHLLHLGDFGVWPGRAGAEYLNTVSWVASRRDIQVLIVDGNHEDFDQLDALTPSGDGTAELAPNVHHLMRGSRWTWGGLTWMSLGGATSLDVHLRTIGKDWWPQEAITQAQADAAIEGGPVDVLLTHDAPSRVSIPGLSTDWRPDALRAASQHRELLDAVGEAVTPALWMHGHFHVGYTQNVRFSDRKCTMTGFDQQWKSQNLDTASIETIASLVESNREDWLHMPGVAPRPKMDTPTGMFGGICSCGWASDGLESAQRAMRSAQQHAEAKRE